MNAKERKSEIEKQAAKLRKLGWGASEAQSRAKIIIAGRESACTCALVRHLPGDKRCPATK